MRALLVKEISSFFNGMIAYIVIIMFLLVTGLLVWVFPETNVLDYGYADLSPLFYFAPFVFMFLIPAICMRSFSEEKKSGTLELLMTQPLRIRDIVWGKYLACTFIMCLTLLPTVLYGFSIYFLSLQKIAENKDIIFYSGNMDIAGTLGSYLGLFFLGAVFSAIGVFASVITKDQITAFVMAVFFCFLLYFGFTAISNIDQTSTFSFYMEQLGIDYHYQAISKGLIDLKNVIYFLSVIALMLYFTHQLLKYQK